MNMLRQHTPPFHDLPGPPAERRFETTDELLALDIVKPYEELRGFSHFALNGAELFAVYGNGTYWMSVGSIADPSTVLLRKWEQR